MAVAGSQALFPESPWWPLEIRPHWDPILQKELRPRTAVTQVEEGAESEFKLAIEATGSFPTRPQKRKELGGCSPRTCVLLRNWEGSFVPLNIQSLVPSPLTGHLSIAPSARISLTHKGRSWGQELIALLAFKHRGFCLCQHHSHCCWL